MKEIRLRIFGEAVIEVGDTQVTPTSSHIFALLLLLTLGPKEGWTRRELAELMFEGVDGKEASHRLRQLLYRLRGMGVELAEDRRGLMRIAQRIPTSSEIIDVALAQSDAQFTLEPLVHYEPFVSRGYKDWLEENVSQLRRIACAALDTSLTRSRQLGEWEKAATLASMLLRLDEANASAAVSAAEALSMQGLSRDAVALLDRFVESAAPEADVARKLSQTRKRIQQAGLQPRSSPMRGRSEILSRLGAEWQMAQESGARVFSLIGPPGIGKTRIAESFAEHVSLGGHRILKQRCDAHARSEPLGLFAGLLPSLRALPGSIGVSPTHLRALDLFADETSPHGCSPRNSAESEAVRLDLRLAITDLFDAVTRDRPLLLLVDDAHWLDSASLAIFTQLADGQNDARILVVMCFRPRADEASQLFGARRCASHIVPPLSEVDARTLLTDIAPPLLTHHDLFDSIIEDAAGNPFYIYTLAKRGHSDSSPAFTALHSIATRAYLALSSRARCVLELCLFLDKHATLARVAALAGQESGELLESLRELESADLISCAEGQLRGPHELMNEAFRQLVPSSVAAQLHRTIARGLTDASDRDVAAMTLAWDAVRHWLSSGDAREAVQLALRCASHALDIGEPAAGAELLHQVQGLPLPTHERVAVLDRLVRLSAIGRRTDLLEEALLERRAIALTTREAPATVAELTIRLFASRGHFDRDAISHLEELLEDESLPVAIRSEACARLMVHADLHFDRQTAADLASHLVNLPDESVAARAHLRRASLVYHTSFGSVQRARSLIRESLNAHPRASLEDENTISRDYAAVALIRLGLLPQARNVALATYSYLATRGVRNGAEYEACLLSHIELSLGRLQSTEKWLTVIEQIAKDSPNLLVVSGSGYYSSAIRIAMLAGNYSRAEYLNSQAAKLFQPHFAPRIKSVWLALGLRLSQFQSKRFPSTEIDELLRLYEVAKRLGGQDTVVEALWAAVKDFDGEAAASSMLRDYLFDARREVGGPDWSLSATTADDPAMQEYQASRILRSEG